MATANKNAKAKKETSSTENLKKRTYDGSTRILPSFK